MSFPHASVAVFHDHGREIVGPRGNLRYRPAVQFGTTRAASEDRAYARGWRTSSRLNHALTGVVNWISEDGPKWRTQRG